MFRNAISLKLVVGTYMGGTTPVYNEKKILVAFFKLLFGYPTANFGDIFTHPISITVLHFRPEGHKEPRKEVGSLSPNERLVGFEPGTFLFSQQRLDSLGHSPKQLPLESPFIEYLLHSVYEKSTIFNLVSDGTNFVSPSRNTDQLLQIDVNTILILIVFL